MAEVTHVAEWRRIFRHFRHSATCGFTNFHTMSEHYGNVVTHTLDNDTLLKKTPPLS